MSSSSKDIDLDSKDKKQEEELRKQIRLITDELDRIYGFASTTGTKYGTASLFQSNEGKITADTQAVENALKTSKHAFKVAYNAVCLQAHLSDPEALRESLATMNASIKDLLALFQTDRYAYSPSKRIKPQYPIQEAAVESARTIEILANAYTKAISDKFLYTPPSLTPDMKKG
ncbi:MAG: hypothetical protein ACYCQI_05945 [Gammaproteobacteria bacterium]